MNEIAADRAGAERRAPTRGWPFIAPLGATCVLFVLFSLPPYLTGDPGQSRVPAPPGFPAHYPLLVAHVLFGTVALLTACLQVWPWLRKRHPVVHRTVGRIYVFAGVLPAGLLGLVVGASSPFGPVARVSNVLLATLWVGFTLVGYRMARRQRTLEHRRFMVRSFALTVSIITNRVWGAIAYVLLAPGLGTTFAGREQLLGYTVAGLATWMGWVLTLLAAEAWLERDIARLRARA